MCSSRNGRLFLAVFSAVLGNFNFGFALVYPSPVIPQLQAGEDQNLHMDVHQMSWFGVSTVLHRSHINEY